MGATISIHLHWNAHHPIWDEPCNSHLFTDRALEQAGHLLQLIGWHHLKTPLPAFIPTLRAFSIGNYTCVDNVFCSDELLPVHSVYRWPCSTTSTNRSLPHHIYHWHITPTQQLWTMSKLLKSRLEQILCQTWIQAQWPTTTIWNYNQREDEDGAEKTWWCSLGNHRDICPMDQAKPIHQTVVDRRANRAMEMSMQSAEEGI